MITKALENRPRLVVFVVVVASIFSSVLRYWLDPVLNDDAQLYVHMAHELARGNTGVLAMYDLSIYPTLIAVFSKLFWVDVITAGIILNSMLMGLVAYAFLRCYRLFFLDTRYLWLAGAVFLCHELLIDYRSSFLREFGMWAFSLCAIAEARKYQLSPSHRSTVLWPAYLLVAISFRPEAMVLLSLAIVPLLNASSTRTERLKAAFQWNRYLIVAVVVTGVLTQFSTAPIVDAIEVRITKLWVAMQSSWAANTVTFADHMFKHPADHSDARFGLAAALSVMLLLKILGAWTPYYFLPSAFLYRHLRWDVNARALFMVAILSLIASLVFFMFSRWFMSTRYASLTGILLLLPTSFVFAEYLQKSRIAPWVIGLMLLAGFIDGYDSARHDRSHLRDAIAWSKNNLPKSATLVSNEAQLAFQPLRTIKIKDQRQMSRVKGVMPLLQDAAIEKWSRMDYLIVELDENQQDYLEALTIHPQLSPIKNFVNKDGERVTIFQVTR